MKVSEFDFEALAPELVAFRRRRHIHPENGWTEFLATSDVIHELQKLGIPYLYGKDIHTKGPRNGLPSDEELERCMARAIAEGGDPELIENMRGGYTGVVGIIETGRPGPVTALRCDMDCNDVTETTDPAHFPVQEGFASQHPCLMHACGHDCHTTIGVGTARVLMACKDQLCGTIKLIFQPAEEGTRGGESMAASGILEDVDYLFGGHMGCADEPLGTIQASMENSSFSYKVDLEFHGKSAHAGMAPEEGHNALAAASAATLNLLAISRSAKGSTRINVGTCEAGPGRNVVPDHALLKAEVRGGSEELNEYMFRRMKTVCQAAADMYECTFDYHVMGHSIHTPGDPEMVELVTQVAKETPGIDTVVPAHDMRGGCEDVAFLMREVQKHGGKTTFMWIGANTIAVHHNDHFNVDERVLPLTVRFYSNIVCKLNHC